MAETFRTNYVLVDLENIQPSDLSELDPEQFVVHVFVGANQNKISSELAASLQRMGSRSSYIQIAGNGRNALDFHIACYLGELHREDPRGYFHVLSKNKGFDPLIQHLRARKVFAARIESVLEIPIIRAMKAISPEESIEIVLARLNQLKASRPRKIGTLASTIFALFHKKLSETDVTALVGELQQRGYIDIADNRVSYRLPGDA